MLKQLGVQWKKATAWKISVYSVVTVSFVARSLYITGWRGIIAGLTIYNQHRIHLNLQRENRKAVKILISGGKKTIPVFTDFPISQYDK